MVERFLKIAVLLCAVAAASFAHGAAAGRYRLVAYVANAENLPTVDATKVTAVNFAFARIDKVQVVLDAAAEKKLAQLVALKKQNPNLKVLLSVGGWGADGFSNAASGEIARRAFAASAADIIARNQLDGLDIDWEYPGLPGPGIRFRDTDRENFTALLKTVRARFDDMAKRFGRSADDPYLLTAALADSEFVAHVELDQVHKYLDWINLMTYDFHNSLTKTTGHHAALRRSASAAADERSVEGAVEQFLKAGVPAAKLVVGVPFYGRAFTDVTAQNHGLDQPYGRYDGEHPWPQLKSEFIDRNGFVRYRDTLAHEPYLWNEEKRTFVTYDDPQSLKLKADYVRSKKLGGMMYWEQSQDPDGQLVGILADKLH
ncbi:MAG TPA: glycoside hydrolase family 18 protein [Rudaea sp.]